MYFNTPNGNRTRAGTVTSVLVVFFNSSVLHGTIQLDTEAENKQQTSRQ